MICRANVGLMMGHRLRRWSSIKPTLVQRHMFAGEDNTENAWMQASLRAICDHVLAGSLPLWSRARDNKTRWTKDSYAQPQGQGAYLE